MWIRHISYQFNYLISCLLYTSDAADDLLCVDLGGRRIIKSKVVSREELIEVIKENTEPTCYERPENT